MNLQFHQKLVYKIPTQLPDELLDSIEKYIDDLEYKKSLTGDKTEVDQSVLSIRNSDISFIPWDEWIPAIMFSLIQSANLEYFKYDIDYFETKVQATRYSAEEEQFYGWHIDLLDHTPKERKLSCSLLVNDDYEGGELQFSYNKWFQTIKPERGDVLVFPSWLPHRVRKVKSGTRKSLVGWVCGPNFK